MDRSAAVVLVVLCVLSVAFTPTASATTSGQRMVTPPGFDRTVFHIEVYRNGSARWTFEYSKPLTNASERERYEDFAAEFRANESDLYRRFVNRAKILAATGTNQTGRNMTATGFARDAYVGSLGNRGVITMSFLWTNFAVVRGDRVVVGDVFEGGLYIAPEQQLRFERGPGLAFASVDPAPDQLSNETLARSDSVTWFGEYRFSDNHPHLELVPEGSLRTPTPSPAPATPTPADTGTTAPGGGSGTMGTGPMLVGLVVLGLGLGGAVAWRTGAFSGGAGAGARAETDTGDSAGGQTAESATASDGTTAETADAEPAVSDEELLSDSDRVVNLLEENGGRMKQVDIVEETDWSKSKVSMLLSDMEDDGEISKLRVGRENIVSLSGHEPDAASSPFDDE